jgi:hypothetical protein
LYSSPDAIRIIKSRRIRWAGYVARRVEKKMWLNNIKMDLGEIGDRDRMAWGGLD